jgi:hypothetical protein
VRKVMSLKNKDDFLMHGVVLQESRFSGAALFHVKHFCVNAPRGFVMLTKTAGRD